MKYGVVLGGVSRDRGGNGFRNDEQLRVERAGCAPNRLHDGALFARHLRQDCGRRHGVHMGMVIQHGTIGFPGPDAGSVGHDAHDLCKYPVPQTQASTHRVKVSRHQTRTRRFGQPTHSYSDDSQYSASDGRGRIDHTVVVRQERLQPKRDRPVLSRVDQSVRRGWRVAPVQQVLDSAHEGACEAVVIVAEDKRCTLRFSFPVFQRKE